MFQEEPRHARVASDSARGHARVASDSTGDGRMLSGGADVLTKACNAKNTTENEKIEKVQGVAGMAGWLWTCRCERVP